MALIDPKLWEHLRGEILIPARPDVGDINEIISGRAELFRKTIHQGERLKFLAILSCDRRKLPTAESETKMKHLLDHMNFEVKLKPPAGNKSKPVITSAFSAKFFEVNASSDLTCDMLNEDSECCWSHELKDDPDYDSIFAVYTFNLSVSVAKVFVDTKTILSIKCSLDPLLESPMDLTGNTLSQDENRNELLSLMTAHNQLMKSPKSLTIEKTISVVQALSIMTNNLIYSGKNVLSLQLRNCTSNHSYLDTEIERENLPQSRRPMSPRKSAAMNQRSTSILGHEIKIHGVTVSLGNTTYLATNSEGGNTERYFPNMVEYYSASFLSELDLPIQIYPGNEYSFVISLEQKMPFPPELTDQITRKCGDISIGGSGYNSAQGGSTPRGNANSNTPFTPTGKMTAAHAGDAGLLSPTTENPTRGGPKSDDATTITIRCRCLSAIFTTPVMIKWSSQMVTKEILNQYTLPWTSPDTNALDLFIRFPKKSSDGEKSGDYLVDVDSYFDVEVLIGNNMTQTVDLTLSACHPKDTRMLSPGFSSATKGYMESADKDDMNEDKSFYGDDDGEMTAIHAREKNIRFGVIEPDAIVTRKMTFYAHKAGHQRLPALVLTDELSKLSFIATTEFMIAVNKNK
eukprot:CAMPEP_0115041966 /NCGR_PEP_ID=MMETSP0216-20121206/45987_1 /TAXON_ID=223996 /ORGANISM="Protocruzia adherens, Strain Boccale" /LENGTH=629 /DNA_ID=CAMNT_0002423995 /DNA_START=85 /DNA_END=1974 /DNA_ORIENTATION=+